jgi:hypothetical protein
MLPFLDPGSEIHDSPDKFGYRLFYRGLEDHRKALVSLNWKHRLNFETQWMSRDELVDTSYAAVRKLTLSKQAFGKLPDDFAESIVERIDLTRALLRDIDEMQALADGPEKTERMAAIKRRVLEYNQDQLRAVMSQQRPVDVGFARQQWFDTDEAIDEVLAHG